MPALLPSRRWKVLRGREGRRGIRGLRFLPRCRSLRHADRRVSRLRVTRSPRHRFRVDRTHYPSRALHLMVRCQKWSDLPFRSRMRPRYRPVELRSWGGGLSVLTVGGQGSCGHHKPAGEHGGQRPAQHAPFRIRLHSRSFSRQEPAPLAPGCQRRCRTVSILTPSLHLIPDGGKDDRKSKGMEAAR